nr:PIN domain-containing protein [Candidatus Njordarchaeota archaeon]
MKRIYIDTSVWCRPFDEPSKRVLEEEEALYVILEKSFKGEVKVVTSVAVDFEVSRIKDPTKRTDTKDIIEMFADLHVKEVPLSLRNSLIEEVGLRPLDATHLAIAASNAEYFITVDDTILIKAIQIENLSRLKVKKPQEFLEEINT